MRLQENGRRFHVYVSQKVALVTGGSRGIGVAIVKRLAADGAVVAITYSKDEDAASSVVKAIERTGGKAIAIQADAADAESDRYGVESRLGRLGPTPEVQHSTRPLRAC